MVIYYDGAKPQEAGRYEEAAALVIAGEGLRTDMAEVSVTFVDEETIRALNLEHRGKDSVTDVLSFPQFDDLEDAKELAEGGIPYPLGDVVICTARAKEQAEEYGQSLDRETVYLFVHSLLHLLGYDHMIEKDKTRMRQKEEAVMAKLDLTRE